MLCSRARCMRKRHLEIDDSKRDFAKLVTFFGVKRSAIRDASSQSDHQKVTRKPEKNKEPQQPLPPDRRVEIGFNMISITEIDDAHHLFECNILMHVLWTPFPPDFDWEALRKAAQDENGDKKINENGNKTANSNQYSTGTENEEEKREQIEGQAKEDGPTVEEAARKVTFEANSAKADKKIKKTTNGNDSPFLRFMPDNPWYPWIQFLNLQDMIRLVSHDENKGMLKWPEKKLRLRMRKYLEEGDFSQPLRVLESTNFSAKFATNLDLAAFPFDYQVLRITLVSSPTKTMNLTHKLSRSEPKLVEIRNETNELVKEVDWAFPTADNQLAIKCNLEGDTVSEWDILPKPSNDEQPMYVQVKNTVGKIAQGMGEILDAISVALGASRRDHLLGKAVTKLDNIGHQICIKKLNTKDLAASQTPEDDSQTNVEASNDSTTQEGSGADRNAPVEKEEEINSDDPNEPLRSRGAVSIYRFWEHEANLSTEGNVYQRMDFYIIAHRESWNVVVTVLAPTGLLCIGSLSVFAIPLENDPEAIGDRLSILFTIILAIIANSIAAQGRLPRVNYTTWADWCLNLMLALVYASVIQTAVTGAKGPMDQGLMDQYDEYCFYGFVSLYAVSFLIMAFSGWVLHGTRMEAARAYAKMGAESFKLEEQRLFFMEHQFKVDNFDEKGQAIPPPTSQKDVSMRLASSKQCTENVSLTDSNRHLKVSDKSLLGGKKADASTLPSNLTAGTSSPSPENPIFSPDSSSATGDSKSNGT